MGFSRVYPFALVIAAFAALLGAAAVASREINTYAGNGTAGYAGDGGPATSANLDTPYGIAVADNGDVYIADSVNMVIRKVDYATGDISTFAGSLNTIGDGLSATAATLNTPNAVTIDGSSNLYIADTKNYRIRKVTNATGLISTIGGTGIKGYSGDGGTATDAEISSASGIAVDSSSNTMFVDTDNSRIRKITPGGTITTIAGTGAKGYSGDGGAATAAKVNKPRDIRIDSSDNIYFVDTDNSRIRKFTDGGNISTIAGTGTKGYSGDGGAATSAKLNKPRGLWVDESSGTVFYVADTDNNVIRKFTEGGNISTVAGTGTQGYSGDGGAATSAKLDKPKGVAMDSGGELYIADTGNDRIRVVDSVTGNISTYGGTGTAGYSGDGGAATSADIDTPLRLFVDGADDLFFADSANHVIRKIAFATGNISVVAGIAGQTIVIGDGQLATAAYLDVVEDVAIDSSNNLYIAATAQDRIRKVDGSTGIITTIAGTGVAGYSGDAGLATLAQIKTPRGVMIDDSGNIYIADTDNHVVRKFTDGGNISTVAGTGTKAYTGDGGAATSADLNKPRGVDVDADGNIYIADTDNNCVRKVDGATGVIDTIAGTGAKGYSGDGGLATAAKLTKPYTIQIDEDGKLYIADTQNSAIRVIDIAGIIETIAGTGNDGYSGDGGPADSAKLDNPGGLGFNLTGSGYLYIGDTDNNRVRYFKISGLTIVSWQEVEP